MINLRKEEVKSFRRMVKTRSGKETDCTILKKCYFSKCNHLSFYILSVYTFSYFCLFFYFTVHIFFFFNCGYF